MEEVYDIFWILELIVRKGIKSWIELLVYVNEKKLIGKSDIVEFIVNWGFCVVLEVLIIVWKMINV